MNENDQATQIAKSVTSTETEVAPELTAAPVAETTNSRLPKLGRMPIYLNGRIEYEWCLGLKLQLKNLHKNHPSTELILDLKDLDFIGSSSILHFVDVIKQLHKEGLSLKLVNVQIEFIKVFQLYQLFEVDILPPQLEKFSTPTPRSLNKKIKTAEGHA